MGRRHFHVEAHQDSNVLQAAGVYSEPHKLKKQFAYHPVPRAAQVSLTEYCIHPESAQREEHECHTAKRISSRGAVPAPHQDAFCSSVEDGPAGTNKRHYGCTEWQESNPEAKAINGKKHIAATRDGHIGCGPAPQVVRGGQNSASRRIYHDKPTPDAGTGHRPEDSDKLLPQRRHLKVEDHMVGASVEASGYDSSRITGASKARSSKTPVTGAVAELFSQDASLQVPLRPRTPGRKQIEPEGNLMGGTMRPAAGSRSASRGEWSIRRAHVPEDNLVGGTHASVGSHNNPPERSRQPRSPADNLVGATLKEGPPATQAAPVDVASLRLLGHDASGAYEAPSRRHLEMETRSHTSTMSEQKARRNKTPGPDFIFNVVKHAG
eukprot:gnl/TRDRNA2_/TRDRNA2_182984_c0_seq1.p1 gnl/TRDRNA2_/TRDRNA2_182984_c0~~gnl/TRDRNA2_/TRDRNA2_182984_c0_seq1.p1  ORF type:complete len:380 (+),score=61.80 gnl/TRDRNA2_/TRDRNA2_182984_c0_seq1:82-1221(+)